MPARLPAGPIRTIRTREGADAPFYLLPFDERGLCTGPATRAHLLAAASARAAGDSGSSGGSGGATGDGDGTGDGASAQPGDAFTDIVLFCHGWNNDWTVATERFADFIDGFAALRRGLDAQATKPWRPLLVGVFWPSTAWVFGEDERGPDIAAGGMDVGGAGSGAGSGVPDAGEQDVVELLASLSAGLSADDALRLYALAQADALDADGARALAKLVAPRLAADDELGGGGAEADAPPDADELVTLWAAAATVDDGAGAGSGSATTDGSGGGAVGATSEGGPDGHAGGLEDFGTVGGSSASGGAGGTTGQDAGDPDAAGLFSAIDPRKALRLLTVWRMKDRAGVVGAHGVGPLVREILETTSARVHLVGHSFGAKVMLSAVAAGPAPVRPVRSMLLLQPAVSHLCFAPAGRVPGTARPGGYHEVPARVELPVVSTFSNRDVALRHTFHLMLRRKRDLGEAEIAAPGEPPSRYCALGGYGPREASQALRDLPAAREAVDLPQDIGVLGLDGGVEDAAGRPRISGHGDISNEATWWLLHALVNAD